MRYLNLIKNVSNWPTYFRDKAGLNRVDTVEFRLRGGPTVLVPHDVLPEFKDVVFNECYVKGMPNDVEPGSDIIDVGANIGAFTFLASSLFPHSRVMAFEPDPVNFAQLEKNYDRNPGRRIVIARRAVGAASGKALFSKPEHKRFTTSGAVVQSPVEGAFQVDVIGIAELFSDFVVERCGLLKLDCEGAEFEILRAAPREVLDRISQMIVEVHAPLDGGEHSVAGLAAFLRQRGFHTKPGRLQLLWAWH